VDLPLIECLNADIKFGQMEEGRWLDWKMLSAMFCGYYVVCVTCAGMDK